MVSGKKGLHRFQEKDVDGNPGRDNKGRLGGRGGGKKRGKKKKRSTRISPRIEDFAVATRQRRKTRGKIGRVVKRGGKRKKRKKKKKKMEEAMPTLNIRKRVVARREGKRRGPISLLRKEGGGEGGGGGKEGKKKKKIDGHCRKRSRTEPVWPGRSIPYQKKREQHLRDWQRKLKEGGKKGRKGGEERGLWRRSF